MNGKIDFSKQVQEMKTYGLDIQPERFVLNIPDARENLYQGLSYFLDNAIWLPPYDSVAEWLSDSKGKGLLLYGNCGLGKTIIACKILPVLIKHYQKKIVKVIDAQDMNRDIDTFRKTKMLVIDDIGCEGISNNYGEKRVAFSEIIDAAEKYGNLIIATTNLDLKEMAARYGDRTMDRIVSTMRCVKITGKSLRKNT